MHPLPIPTLDRASAAPRSLHLSEVARAVHRPVGDPVRRDVREVVRPVPGVGEALAKRHLAKSGVKHHQSTIAVRSEVSIPGILCSPGQANEEHGR